MSPTSSCNCASRAACSPFPTASLRLAMSSMMNESPCVYGTSMSSFPESMNPRTPFSISTMCRCMSSLLSWTCLRSAIFCETSSRRRVVMKLVTAIMPSIRRVIPAPIITFREMESRSVIGGGFSGIERSGGGSGIRTHGALRPAGFQDRCIRPLCHPSGEAQIQAA